ncbi:MAG TPA: hypothetical protein VII92_02530, partial [Anaerolineae bacterium]
MYSTIIAIKLSDDFVEGTDFHWQEILTDGADAASFTDRAGVTFTPNGSDRWLVAGQASFDPTATGVNHRMEVQDSVGPTSYGTCDWSSNDVDDTYNFLYFFGLVPTAASHTFKVRTLSATSTTVRSSRILTLNLAKFVDSASDYTAGSTTPATAPSWTTVATVSPTPTATGNFVILSNALAAPLTTDNVFARLQINPSGAGLSSNPAYGDDCPDNVQNSNSLFHPGALMTVLSLTSGAARACNMDWNKAGGSPLVQSRAIVVFSVALAAGGTQYQQSVAGSLTTTGALFKRADQNKAGTVTMAGALIKRVDQNKAGSITGAGVLTKLGLKNFTASIATGATIINAYLASLTLAGSIALAGTLVKKVNLTFSAVISTAGSLVKLV